MKSSGNNSKTKYILLAAVGAAILAVLLVLLLRSCGAEKQKESSPQGTGIELSENDNLSDSGPEQRSAAEILADLNRQVENSMLTMAINPDPVFASGNAEGNLLIENDPQNRYAQVVEIYRDDTNERIYNSGLIPIGKFVNTDTLDVVLEAGDYPCTAYFSAMDEAGVVMGTGGVHLTVHIHS